MSQKRLKGVNQMQRVTIAAFITVISFLASCFLLLALCLVLAEIKAQGQKHPLIRAIHNIHRITSQLFATDIPNSKLQIASTNRTEKEAFLQRNRREIEKSGVAIAFIIDATPSTKGTDAFLGETDHFFRGGYLNEKDSASVIRLDDSPRLVYGMEHVSRTRALREAAQTCGKSFPGKTGTDPYTALEIGQLWLRNYPAKRRILWIYSDLINDPTRQGTKIVRRYRDPLSFSLDRDVEIWFTGLNAEQLARVTQRFPTAHVYLANHRHDLGRELNLKASDF